MELDSMRDAMFTVSPNRQYRGILRPTTPATTGPAQKKKRATMVQSAHLATD
ncbi:hypothetical protein DPMN_174328 [Dreissena polymorpha]|uniref:Uncharacterized protein n=1 Tax=Dreissena polymorpha TaxID=45954 RepID=A0A9D4E6W9_DREPO|nr:hypothetical protein DPMN_174328 [Dreissena polymorpha]